jgi:hypothetical protein
MPITKDAQDFEEGLREDFGVEDKAHAKTLRRKEKHIYYSLPFLILKPYCLTSKSQFRYISWIVGICL